MGSNGNDTVTVTLRVHRFTPRAERERPGRPASPFARKASPFGSSAHRRPRGRQWTQDYTLTVRREDTVLDCLLVVKRTVDPTLAFRYSCGHGMCGSDAVAINGTPALLCTASVSEWARPLTDRADDADGFRPTGETSTALENGLGEATEGVIELAALPGFPVQRDLIADIDPMLGQIRRLRPYLQARDELRLTPDGKVNVFEYLQRPEELARYEQLTNCIACGVCEGACPVYAGGEAFIGPAALIAASRFVNDSRDGRAMERMDQIDTEDGVTACQSVRACGRQCPRGIDVGEEMWQIVAKVRERHS